MATIKITTDDGEETALWEDSAKQIGSLVDRANTRKLTKAILFEVQATRIRERQAEDKKVIRRRA